MAANDKKPTKSRGSQEQIVAGFNELRQQQRAMASKISELEIEHKEHDLVLDTLRDVDPDRKCFRLIGGILVERTVKEVLPALEANNSQINKLLGTLSKQLEAKGHEINAYRETHNIQVRGEEGGARGGTQDGDKSTKPSSTGVLVAKDS